MVCTLLRRDRAATAATLYRLQQQHFAHVVEDVQTGILLLKLMPVLYRQYEKQ